MLDSKRSLFCSKICGTNKKGKSTRYASHFVYTGARTTPGLQLSYCAAIFALLYSFWSKRENCSRSTLFFKDKSKFSYGLPSTAGVQLCSYSIKCVLTS